MSTHPHPPTQRTSLAASLGQELSHHLEHLVERLVLGRSFGAIPIRISAEELELDLHCGRGD